MEQKVKWSEKYGQFIKIDRIHPNHKNLTFISEIYWYDFKKDKMIHKDILESYINNTMGKLKTIKKEKYLEKRKKEQILKNEPVIDNTNWNDNFIWKGEWPEDINERLLIWFNKKWYVRNENKEL